MIQADPLNPCVVNRPLRAAEWNLPLGLPLTYLSLRTCHSRTLHESVFLTIGKLGSINYFPESPQTLFSPHSEL